MQVHNTYGEHSNAELLRKYGFALPANPFDSVTLAAAALVAAAEASSGGGGTREARQRVRWLNAQRCGLGPGAWALPVFLLVFVVFVHVTLVREARLRARWLNAQRCARVVLLRAAA